MPEFIQPLELPHLKFGNPNASGATDFSTDVTQSKEVILRPILQKSISHLTHLQDIDEYTVLGESIDYEMKEKIRGSDNGNKDGFGWQ